MFLDRNQPLHSCKEENCNKCDISDDLNCHFNGVQLLKFLLMAFPFFFFSGVNLYQISKVSLLYWGVGIIAYFGFIEIRVMCSHCPHYGEPGFNTLKCWANYGSPKIWKYRPGPMNLTEKIVFFAGLAAVMLYPLLMMIQVNRLISATIASLVLVVFLTFLHTKLCTICMNFACPLNKVDQETREKFFMHNPSIEKAWKKESN